MAKKNKKSRGGGQQFLSPEKYLQQKARGLEIGTCYVTKDPADLRKAIGKRPPMPTQPFTDDDARRFTTDEIQEAGYGDVPTIPNERQKEFWHFLTRDLGWDDHYARRICFELWYKANHADDPSNDDDETIEEYFNNEALSLDDITEEERRKGRRLLADYVAHIPRWTLKGHAPAERQTP